MVIKTNCDTKEAELKLMHPAGLSPFSFPRRDDILVASHTNILMKANPNPTTATGRVYNISSAEAVFS